MSNAEVWSTIEMLAAILLIPGFPAVIIYRLLPDQRVFVKTNFHGVQLNATGAFAGYFVLVIVAFAIARDVRASHAAASPFETWTIHGNLRVDDPRDSATGVSITIFPPLQDASPTGPTTARFRVVASILKSDNAGTVLQATKPPYAPATFPVGLTTVIDPVTNKSYGVRRDPENHVMTILDTLVLRRVTPYDPKVAFTPQVIP